MNRFCSLERHEVKIVCFVVFGLLVNLILIFKRFYFFLENVLKSAYEVVKE